MKFCCFDIETIPCQSLPKSVRPEFDLNSVKLGNIKDPVKAGEKIDGARKEFDEALDKKMSLDPDLCEVVCCSTYYDGASYTYCQIQQHQIIEFVWDNIKGFYLDHIPLVSYNGIAFDLPVLLHAALKLNIPVSPRMYADLTKKYSTRYHVDLMQWFSGWDRTKWKSLDFYLNLFEIEGEKIGKGSDVYEWWKNQEYDKIREHCEQDVILTAKLFERVAPWIIEEDETI